MSTDAFTSPPSVEPLRRGSGLAITALVLALAALGLASWTALRPAPKPSAGVFSAAQQSEAKVAACGAANLVRRGVSLNTNLQSPGGEGDVTGSLAVAANARLSLSEGGHYLLHRLDDATPAELSDAVQKFANTLMDIGAAATAGAQNTDPDQAARLQAADTENARVAELCR
jgi:hypothetical protein